MKFFVRFLENASIAYLDDCQHFLQLCYWRHGQENSSSSIFLAKTVISYKENSLLAYFSRNTVANEFKLSKNVYQMNICNFWTDTMLGKSRFLVLKAANMQKIASSAIFWIYLFTNSIYQLNSSPTFQLTSSPTVLLPCSLTHLLTYSPTLSTNGGSTSSSLADHGINRCYRVRIGSLSFRPW